MHSDRVDRLPESVFVGGVSNWRLWEEVNFIGGRVLGDSQGSFVKLGEEQQKKETHDLKSK